MLTDELDCAEVDDVKDPEVIVEGLVWLLGVV